VVTAVTAVTAATVATVVIAVMTAGGTTVRSLLLVVVEAVDPLVGGETVAADVAALLHGLTSLAKSAIKKAILPKTVGPATPRMMTMVTRKFMPPMVLTPIGTRTPAPPITSRVSSTI
jgi:hypothetical protein